MITKCLSNCKCLQARTSRYLALILARYLALVELRKDVIDENYDILNNQDFTQPQEHWCWTVDNYFFRVVGTLPHFESQSYELRYNSVLYLTSQFQVDQHEMDQDCFINRKRKDKRRNLRYVPSLCSVIIHRPSHLIILPKNMKKMEKWGYFINSQRRSTSRRLINYRQLCSLGQEVEPR